MSNFAEFNLHSNINKAITACGYTVPTPVQAKSIPEVLDGRDVVVSAQTGTGKTAAFVLPALHNLSTKEPSRKTRVLILTPTRELASQITKAAGLYGKFMRFNIVSLVGGMPYHNQIRDLGRGADIIVATPGRLLDHLEQKRVDLSDVEMLVLDEADRMLDMGFIEDVQYIAKLTPASRQTLLFSATLDNKLMNAVKHLLKNPVRIDLSNEKMTAPKIRQEMYKTNNLQHKTRLLKHFLNDENIFKAIIFSATKINADKLATQLRDEGFSAAALHGDLRQNVRNRTLESLRRGKIQFLVATDVAARGIDISDITHVFNFDLPRFYEDYVHRIGRTGRAGKEGVAISFVLPSDTRQVSSIERYIGQRIKIINHVDIDDNAEPKNRNYVPEPKERHSNSGRAGGGERFGRGDQKRERYSRGGDEKRERPSKFSDIKREYTSRFGDEKREHPTKFGDEKRERSSVSRFGDDKRERPRFGDEKRERSSSRFGDEKRERPKFGDEKRERSSSRFDDEKRERPSKFGDAKRERSSSRFGDEKRERPSKFGDEKRERSSASRFGAEKRERPSKFGDEKRERSSRFGDEKRERPSKFGDEKRERSSSRFGDEKRERPKRDDDRRPASRGKPGFKDSKERSNKFSKTDKGDRKSAGDFKHKKDAKPKFGARKKNVWTSDKNRSESAPTSGDKNRAYKKRSLEGKDERSR